MARLEEHFLHNSEVQKEMCLVILDCKWLMREEWRDGQIKLKLSQQCDWHQSICQSLTMET